MVRRKLDLKTFGYVARNEPVRAQFNGGRNLMRSIIFKSFCSFSFTGIMTEWCCLGGLVVLSLSKVLKLTNYFSFYVFFL